MRNIWGYGMVCCGICVLTSFPSTSGFAQDISSGLEGHWTFDGSNGTSAADSSGNGRTANARQGNPTVVDGVKGSALQFDGDDALEVTDWYGIAGSSPRTVTCWVKSTDLNTHGIVSWGLSSSNGTKYHIRINNNAGNGVEGALRTEIQGTFLIGTTPVNDDEWHFIASVFPDGGVVMVDVMLYVDGELEAEESTNGNGESIELLTSASAADSDQLVQIGSRQQGANENFFTGLIDDVRIYSRALSGDEIKAIMAQEGGSTSHLDEYMLYR